MVLHEGSSKGEVFGEGYRGRLVQEICRRLLKRDPDIVEIVQFGSSIYAPDLSTFNSIVDHLICVVDQFYSRSLYLLLHYLLCLEVFKPLQVNRSCGAMVLINLAAIGLLDRTWQSHTYRSQTLAI